MTGVEQAHEVTTTATPQRLSRGWHAVLAIVVTASFAGQLYLLAHGETDLSPTGDQGVSVGVRLVRLFSYFTIESNLLVLAAALSLVLAPGRDGRLWRVLRLDALLGIVITGLVFGLVLAGLVHPTGLETWVNAGFHYFSPWWTLAGAALRPAAADRLVHRGLGLCLADRVGRLYVHPRRCDRLVSLSVPGRAHARLRRRRA
jgi:hypothetical protein